MSKLRSVSTDWNPDPNTIIKMFDKDYYVAFKAFRVSSSGYINKKFVRSFVALNSNGCCNHCPTTHNLTVDHIKSVHWCFKMGLLFSCNTIENLQLLCIKCNIKKSNNNG